jgi:preprotein translocase subunit YajC
VTMMVAVALAEGNQPAGSAGGTWLSFVPFILIFVVFYFLLILPQQKRQKKLKAMVDALKKGDKVVTSSGIWGTVANLGKDTVTLQVGDNTKIKIQRDHIARIRAQDEE